MYYNRYKMESSKWMVRMDIRMDRIIISPGVVKLAAWDYDKRQQRNAGKYQYFQFKFI